MVKKLYITGAGASKDLNQKNLLGSELLEQIQNHRVYIYYWLIAMVVARVAKDNPIYTPDYFHFKTIASETIFNHLFYLKENSNSQKKELIPKENCISKEEFDNFRNKLLDNLYKENSFTIKYFLKKEAEDYFNKIYGIANFQIQSFINLDEEKYKVRLDDFKSALNDVSGYVLAIKNPEKESLFFSQYIKPCLNHFKQELISGIVLSFIVNNFNSNFNIDIASIDNIINFLESLSFYNDDYAEKTGLPKIAEIKDFACTLVEDIIATNIYYSDTEKNYINFLSYKWFSRESEKLTSFIDNDINFINFNYDLHLSNFFETNKLYSLVSSNDRKEALEKMKEKLNKSHVYGKITKHTSRNSIDKDWCFLPSFEKYLMYIDFNNNINKITTEIQKRKQNPKISLIRTNQTEDEIKNNFAKIITSDEIYILGFGFDEYNLQNIGIDDDNLKNITNKTVYATNYGDLPRIRLALERIFAVKLYKESESQEKDGEKHSFWRSRDDKTNKRNNNVFVSTKPVYRALSEDFL